MFLRVIITFLFLITLQNLHGQTVISQFNWDGGPVTIADVGPNATSVSGSAVSDVNGTSGTNGLNAGLPKQNIQMVIPGSPTFDVNGIDISFDYQREEAVGTFWRRGSGVVINGCNQFSVSYRVDNGAGGFNTVNSGNVFSIPNDDIFRRYRFIYEPISGIGYLLVNGAVVWSNDGPDNRNLYWTGAGNVIIGSGMDGTGFNKTFLDSLVVADVLNSALPIELVDFNVELTNSNQVEASWTTASENNNDYFLLEKTSDGLNWEEVAKVKSVGNSSELVTYTSTDASPFAGISYYRLTQIDFDGRSETFDIKSIYLEKENMSNAFPNPFERYCFVEEGSSNIQIYSLDGTDVGQRVEFSHSNGLIQLDFQDLHSGVYFIYSGNSRQRVVRH